MYKFQCKYRGGRYAECTNSTANPNENTYGVGRQNVRNSNEKTQGVGRQNLQIPMQIPKGWVGGMYKFQWKCQGGR